MGIIVEVYESLKNDGYQYIAAENIGGETAHKKKPMHSTKCGWVSVGWRFVCKAAEHENIVKKGYMHIDDVIAYAVEHEDDMLRNSSDGKKKKSQRLYRRICAVCGAGFVTRTIKGRCCSNECKNALLFIQSSVCRGRSEESLRATKSMHHDLVNLYFDNKRRMKDE